MPKPIILTFVACYLPGYKSGGPVRSISDDIEDILCASPESVGVQDWFDPLPNVRFVSCKPFRFLFRYRYSNLLREPEMFSPDVIFWGPPFVTILALSMPKSHFSREPRKNDFTIWPEFDKPRSTKVLERTVINEGPAIFRIPSVYSGPIPRKEPKATDR